MTVPTDDIPPEVVDLSTALAALDTLPNRDKVRYAMQIAAQYLEYAAFEMALEQSAGDVSEIIHMAARLDQAARRIDETAVVSRTGQDIRKI
ncbi:hypothetical protein So717_21650 [Roseobacter cerasinus]|uniref:Uncharacterized protein n=1 Tax=Roseobacter cerasinus TaxID=2602289 RepID=A0A640VRV7_9RHOB|nr:hypothetical protein [Roseobacter cerasinus]GFE50412.1 hypothetical protein So717_21650 [Roseobacter cerasinus]